MISRLFKRKPQCIHEWHVADYELKPDINASAPDTFARYTLVCRQCSKVRKVGKLEYSLMRRNGFIKEAAE
jgi:hypothetical protein